jgi:hypothetical protein
MLPSDLSQLELSFRFQISKTSFRMLNFRSLCNSKHNKELAAAQTIFKMLNSFAF